MQVEQLMTRALVACHPDDRLDHAARQMWDHDIGAVVVQDAAGKLVGILTDRDVCMAALTRGRPLADIRVASAMASEVFTCRANAACVDVEAVMTARQVRRVPIVDAEGRPVGMVSLNDLARRSRSSPNAAVNQRGVEATLSAISMPRWTTSLVSAAR